jgi:ABC-type dipeptide/oligopeptide/nickel transport system permease component
MFAFIIKRLVHLIPILLGVSLLTFLLMALTPGDYSRNSRKTRRFRPIRSRGRLRRPAAGIP